LTIESWDIGGDIVFIEFRKERIYSKREKLVFRYMRAFEWDSLAAQIYLCEDLYLEPLIAEVTKNQSIRRLSENNLHDNILLFIVTNVLGKEQLEFQFQLTYL